MSIPRLGPKTLARGLQFIPQLTYTKVDLLASVLSPELLEETASTQRTRIYLSRIFQIHDVLASIFVLLLPPATLTLLHIT